MNVKGAVISVGSDSVLSYHRPFESNHCSRRLPKLGVDLPTLDENPLARLEEPAPRTASFLSAHSTSLCASLHHQGEEEGQVDQGLFLPTTDLSLFLF